MSRRTVVLASASPRRAELLAMLGLACSVAPVGIDEAPRAAEPPADLALRLAREKAIAADTIVIAGGLILGKPRDALEARRFLALLSGRTHAVITGLAVRAWPEEEMAGETVESRVTFASLSKEEIDYMTDLCLLYLMNRLPRVTEYGEKVPSIRIGRA